MVPLTKDTSGTSPAIAPGELAEANFAMCGLWRIYVVSDQMSDPVGSFLAF